MNKVVTLGEFDIIIDGESILENIGNQKRLVRLFKYFLIHKDIKLLPEKIIEDLYGNEDFKRPLNMLRTQIFRIRNLINENELNIQPFYSIEYSSGYYVFKLKEDIRVDFIEFEEVLGDDVLRIKQELEEDELRFKELLLSYKGDLLKEMDDEDWLIPTRIRFDRLYEKGILYYMDYLQEKHMYNEIVEIAERAIEIKPYEDSIYLNLMEALVELEQKEYALRHYEFFTKKLYNDLRIPPSKRVIEFYKKNKFKSDTSDSIVNLNTINGELDMESDSKNVVFCDHDNFKFIYNYEILNKDRETDTSIGLAIMTLESKSYRELSEEEMLRGMELLTYLFYKHLKPVDIVSRWNKRQMLILLYEIQKEDIEKIAKKINEQFDLKKLGANLRLNIKIRNI